MPTLKPETVILTESKIKKGLKNLLVDGVLSQGMTTLSSGAFLIGFALALGASNTIIGILAAIPFIANLTQIPSVWLIEKLRKRKSLSVTGSFLSRLFLLFIAAIPFIFTFNPLLFLVLFMIFMGVLASVSGASFNSWMRDFVPEDIRGRYFAKRMRIAIALSIILSLSGGVFIDKMKLSGTNEIYAYSLLFFVAFILGEAGTYFLASIPEPLMPAQKDGNIFRALSKPLRDKNFKTLITFTSSWGFALNIAAPFFTVYMIKRLGLGLGIIMLITVVSHISTVYFLPIWGRLIDRFSSKSVLKVGVTLYMFAFLLWPFTTLPEKHSLTIPLLFVVHFFLGLANGCISLGTNTIALKFAPQGEATSYLAVNNTLASLFSGIAPFVGGLLSDLLEKLELNMEFFIKGASPKDFVLLNMRGLDFLFIVVIFFGFYAIYCLANLREEGEIEERIIYQELISESRQTIRNLSTIPGFQFLTYIPSQFLVKPIYNGLKGMKSVFRNRQKEE